MKLQPHIPVLAMSRLPGNSISGGATDPQADWKPSRGSRVWTSLPRRVFSRATAS